MPLHLALAATLGFLTFLSSLMLGLGQGDSFLPVLMGIGAVTSFMLTDYRRVVQLGDWTVNAFVILIVCFNVIDVLHHRGEDLAWSIARVLVFVQVVLLFREKEARFGWQILLISLLQVVVSTVFHQSIMFGMLLLLYVFVGLCAFVLLSLQQEHRYFCQHSFVRTFVESIKAEIAERQDHGKLVRIALITLLIGPFTLLLSFAKKQSDMKSTGQSTDKKIQTQKILRSLFLVFPKEEDLAPRERWQSVEDIPVDTNIDEGFAFHAVPNRSDVINTSYPFRRFPLLTERPSFSAGTQNPRPWSGHWRELFIHLTIGTFFAFFVAVILFCLIPRVGQVDFNDITLKQGFENWFQPVRRQISVGTVGINEEIQLGSLGSVIQHHREVINVRFFHNPDNQLVVDTDLSAPYTKIAGAKLYFRGIPLEHYSAGFWTQNSEREPISKNFTMDVRETRLFPFDITRIGVTLFPQDQQNIFFEEDCDLVTLAMNIQPLSSSVFFAPYPFFSLPKQNEIKLQSVNGRSEEAGWRRREANKTIASAVFKQGVQLDLVPCQEWINRYTITQIPDSGLDSLMALAARWDAESGCVKEDIVGRARFMEQKFLLSPEFAYQLGGTLRDYDLDPLEDFIACNPRGHCEYFAGALALMLRSVGIGSRVILGFKTEAFENSASCIIRQSDAHAWVEVYLPPETLPHRTVGRYAFWWHNGGWLRLDPTPASQSSPLMTSLTLQWTDWNLWVQAFWNEFVLNMNPNRQSLTIYQPLSQAWHIIFYRVFNFGFWQELYVDMVWYYRSFFMDNVPKQKQPMWVGFYWVPPIILFILIGLATWRLILILRPSVRQRTVEETRRRITIEFYLRMERMLAKIGLHRKSALTPLEFARQSSFMTLMLPVVDAFYRVRFGNAVLTEEESQSILKTLEQLELLIERL